MIYAILGGAICAFVLGAVIGGAIYYKAGYDRAFDEMLEHQRRKAVLI